MSGPTAIVAIIGAMAALVLALRGLQSHHLPFEKKAQMAVIWALIIIGLAFVLGRMGA